MSANYGYGYVYCLINESLLNVCKIGFTTKTSKLRAKQLSNTSCLTPFVVAFEIKVKNPHKYEQIIHNKLEHIRIKKNREFFEYNIPEIIDAFNMYNLIKNEQEKDDFHKNYFINYVLTNINTSNMVKDKDNNNDDDDNDDDDDDDNNNSDNNDKIINNKNYKNDTNIRIIDRQIKNNKKYIINKIEINDKNLIKIEKKISNIEKKINNIEQKLESHIKNSIKNLKCNGCNKDFSRKYSIMRHINGRCGYIKELNIEINKLNEERIKIEIEKNKIIKEKNNLELEKINLETHMEIKELRIVVSKLLKKKKEHIIYK